MTTIQRLTQEDNGPSNVQPKPKFLTGHIPGRTSPSENLNPPLLIKNSLIFYV